MRRYNFLGKDYIYEAINKLRAAFLAAKDGHDVEEIINGVLTNDEKIKIGRRIQIAQMLQKDYTYEEIKDELKVGLQTIKLISNKLDSHQTCFKLIETKEDKIEKKYKIRAYENTGGSKMIFKKRTYTGYTRKDVER